MAGIMRLIVRCCFTEVYRPLLVDFRGSALAILAFGYCSSKVEFSLRMSFKGKLCLLLFNLIMFQNVTGWPGGVDLKEVLAVGEIRTLKNSLAVKDVDFQLQPGQSLGVIGPNGAGKTTILKLLSKVTHPLVVKFG